MINDPVQSFRLVARTWTVILSNFDSCPPPNPPYGCRHKRLTIHCLQKKLPKKLTIHWQKLPKKRLTIHSQKLTTTTKVEGMEDQNGHQVAILKAAVVNVGGEIEVKNKEEGSRKPTVTKSPKVSTVSKTSPVNNVSFISIT